MTTDVKQLLETMPEAPEAWADAQIGRYVFRRLVGTGGMGIVVAAHDPELDREVAIKIVVTGDTDDTRPIREAQAMARLSHPNVVQVYEVIRLGTRTAIVMELVEGEELGTWQTSPRTWREIVDAYLQASRGLAAAHRAGIVHRDFKPSNALIDREGVVRVTDFGLARSPAERGESGATPVGTPAYMAPEQHRNATIDARTDQWGLACSLYEALYGRRPFASHEGAGLAAAVTRGEIEREPADTQVPRRIRAAIRRALAVDPEERFATVEDFAAALSARSRRRHYAVGVAASLAMIAIVVLATRDSSASSPCAGLDAPIQALWSPRARGEVRARLLAPTTGLPATTVDKVLAGFDAYASSWAATRAQACMDSQQGVRSAETLDTRMRCLDRRLAGVSGLLEALATDDAATLRAAGDAVAQLEPAATCAEPEESTRPERPDLRAEFDAAEQGLARATALVSLGQFERALPVVEQAVVAADHAHAPALTARALVLRGQCEDRLARFPAALATFQRAAKLAAQARDHAVMADAMTWAFLTEGDHLGRRIDASRARPFIELAIDSAGQPDAVRAQWLHFLAILTYDDVTKVDEAAAYEREALAIRRRTLPPDHFYIFDSMETLGNIESARRNYDESARLLTQVLDARIAARGQRDYTVSAALGNLGTNENQRDNMLGAIDYFKRAVDIANAVGRPNLSAQYNLAVTQMDMGQWSAAAANFEASLAGSEREAGKDSRDAGESAMLLGLMWTELGDYERGRPMLLHGVDVCRRSGSPNLAIALAYAARLAIHDGDRTRAHALLAESLSMQTSDAPLRTLTRAEIELAEGGCATARPTFAKALDEARAQHLYMDTTLALVGLAECEIAAGDERPARQRLEAELATLIERKAEEPVLARVRAALAKIKP